MTDVATIDPESIRRDGNELIDYISLEDAERGRITATTRLRLADAPTRARRKVRAGDVLFGTVRPNLQSHAQYKGNLRNPVASTGFAVIRARLGAAVPGFLAQWVLGPDVLHQVEQLIAGSSYPAVSNGDVRQFQICLPDVHTQTAIASTLEDADDLIAAIERLIAKKQAIKQGMLHQLLTGKVRLPGFTKPWKEAALGELATIIGGGTPKSSIPVYWDGEIPWCTPTDITREKGRYLRRTERSISRQGLERSAAELLPVGSLLLCTRATIGAVKIASFPVATNQGFKSLVPRAGVVGEFLYYKMLSLKDGLVMMGTGSTFLEVSGRDVASLELAVPEVDEQNAIATVMADTDDEIDLLRRRLEKATATKAGMMHELLTGSACSPVREAAA